MNPTLYPPPGPTRELLGVTVHDGVVPAPWDAAIRTGAVCADADRFLARQGTASIYVAHGSEVTIQAASEADRLSHDSLVYALAARVLLWQRRRFTLHAAMLVSPGGRGVAVTGSSMAGKSTTMVELIRRGWSFGGDDVLEVTIGTRGPVASPVPRPVHLTDDAAKALGGDPSLGRPVPGRDKRAYSLAGATAPRALDAVVRVQISSEDDVQRRRLEAPQALTAIAGHSDLVGVCQLPPLRGEFLGWTVAVAGRTMIFDVRRPAGSWTVDRVADAVASIAAH